MRRLLWFLPLLLVVPLLLTSSVTCGCEPNPYSIAGQMAIFPVEGNSPASVEKNRQLARSAFLGRPISRLTLSGSPLDRECKFSTALELTCQFWSETGLFFSTGRLVTIAANADGIVNSVSVEISHSWGSRE